MSGATSALPFKGDRHRETRSIRQLVVSTDQILFAKLVFDPSQALQDQLVILAFPNRNRDKPMPFLRADEADKCVFVGVVARWLVSSWGNLHILVCLIYLYVVNNVGIGFNQIFEKFPDYTRPG